MNSRPPTLQETKALPVDRVLTLLTRHRAHKLCALERKRRSEAGLGGKDVRIGWWPREAVELPVQDEGEVQDREEGKGGGDVEGGEVSCRCCSLTRTGMVLMRVAGRMMDR